MATSMLSAVLPVHLILCELFLSIPEKTIGQKTKHVD